MQDDDGAVGLDQLAMRQPGHEVERTFEHGDGALVGEADAADVLVRADKTLEHGASGVEAAAAREAECEVSLEFTAAPIAQLLQPAARNDDVDTTGVAVLDQLGSFGIQFNGLVQRCGFILHFCQKLLQALEPFFKGFRCSHRFAPFQGSPEWVPRHPPYTVRLHCCR